MGYQKNPLNKGLFYGSGGTAKKLADVGIPVKDVKELVGGGAILGHKVVTLSRELHAGLLADYDGPDLLEMESLNLPYINMVCCDMYPLQAEILNPDHTFASVVKQTDIGGPTMIRSGIKGGRIVLADPSDREMVIEWLQAGRPNEDVFIKELAAKAEFIVSRYISESAMFRGDGKYQIISGIKHLQLKYGENPHQLNAAFFTCSDNTDPLSLANIQMIEGVTPSYVSFLDLDRAIETMTRFVAGFKLNFPDEQVPFIAIGVKHGNACGFSVCDDPHETTRKMVSGDSQALFGGTVVINFAVDEKIADAILHQDSETRRPIDNILAPKFNKGVVDILKRKGNKCRILELPALSSLDENSVNLSTKFKSVRGGFVMQDAPLFILDFKHPEMNFVCEQVPSQKKIMDLIIAWAIGSSSNSNTITIVKDGMLIGNGVGQQDRVGAAKLATTRAYNRFHDIKGAVAYSDSFFPFTDGINALIECGVDTIFATTGSVRDKDIIAFCQENNVTLITLPDKVARGFSCH